MDGERVDVFFFKAAEDGAAVDTSEDCGGEEGSEDPGEDVAIDDLQRDDGGLLDTTILINVQLGKIQHYPQQGQRYAEDKGSKDKMESEKPFASFLEDVELLGRSFCLVANFVTGITQWL